MYEVRSWQGLVVTVEGMVGQDTGGLRHVQVYIVLIVVVCSFQSIFQAIKSYWQIAIQEKAM